MSNNYCLTFDSNEEIMFHGAEVGVRCTIQDCRVQIDLLNTRTGDEKATSPNKPRSEAAITTTGSPATAMSRISSLLVQVR